ncbi:MAG: acetamidase/formamidase family protein, partial [Bacilli bacterium]
MHSVHVGSQHIHAYWDRSLAPAMRVSPGAEIYFDLPDASNGEITPETTVDQVKNIDFRKLDPLVGPIWIDGAEAGDALEIDILEIAPKRFGWTAILPDFGLLKDHFKDPRFTIWDVEGRREIEIMGGAKFRLNPMIGCLGVAPPETGRFPSITPTLAGGNIDVRYVVTGNRVILPVYNEGALLSIADAHA